ncbi:MAG: hypothetical protein ACJAWL_001800 [Motiliproteus sp.]|jgi:hypothetical protein
MVKNQNLRHTYQYAYVPLFNATLAAAKTKNLKVDDLDKRRGRLVFSRDISFRRLGERISVFFRAVTPQETEVEIVSQPVFSSLNYPQNWQQLLHEQIEVELLTKR